MHAVASHILWTTELKAGVFPSCGDTGTYSDYGIQQSCACTLVPGLTHLQLSILTLQKYIRAGVHECF